MGLDANIILQGKAPDIQNPMDAMGRIMTFKSLANRNQIEGLQMQQEQQKFNDESAMRNAYAKNTSVDPNGSATLNHGGFMSDLAKSAPHLIPGAQQSMASMDTARMKSALEHVSAGAQILGGVTDQASYDQARQQAVSMGGDVSQWPPQYDPNAVKSMQMKAMGVKEQLEAQAKQQGIDIQKEDLKIKRDQFSATKQADAFKDLMSHAESSRQLPDVKQAYTDRYNTQKILDLIGKGDPNKLNPNMVQLLSSEVGKVATGAAPTEETLKNLTPQDAKMIQARVAQYLSSNPQAGQQGAFVNVFREYAKTLQNGANKVIDSNMGKLGSSYKSHVSEGDYSNFQKNYLSGNPNAAAPNNGSPQESSGGKQSDSKQDYPVGTTAKSKSGVPVIYKGNGVWAPQ